MFAAGLIFVYHFANEDTFFGTRESRDTVWQLTYGGVSAVSFFYLLSGFVLAWSARPGERKGRFWWRRFAKIYPSHLATFLLALAFYLWVGGQLRLPVALANLTLTQAWVPNSREYWFGFNGVSWSLSCEAFFYLCFPFALALVRRLSPRGRWGVVLGGNAFVLLLPPVLGWLDLMPAVKPSYPVYMLPATRLVEFTIGVALALLVKEGHWRGPGLTVSSALALVALLWGVHHLPEPMHYAAATIVPYTLLVAAAGRADSRGTRSVFRQRHLVYLGEASFAFYLVHELVMVTGNEVFRHHPPIATVPNLVAVFSVSLVGAFALHEFVEKPCQRLLTRRRGARPAAPGV
ncbi:macrolide O-acyltransferase [Kitasatospora sp. MMS16-BH015]|nr:macrolide O-acyltransferase [Kitasatospora sp. MMS16-BH015]